MLIVNMADHEGELDVRISTGNEDESVDPVRAVHTITSGLTAVYQQYFDHLGADRFAEIVSDDLLRKLQ